MEDDLSSGSLELEVMCREFEWFLREEVKNFLNDLRHLIMETLKTFNINSNNSECRMKPEKFLLACPNGIHQSKCMVTLSGDFISEADLGIRLQKQPVIIYQTRIYPENPWKLQQIQDAGNHLQCALSAIEYSEVISSSSSSSSSSLSSGARVLSLVDGLIGFLRLGRECICLPKAQPLDLIKSSCSKVFRPPLPQDTVAAFYIQAQKLILSVNHLSSNSQSKVDVGGTRYQLECTVPWLNDALLMFTVALHKCQQLKDKVSAFAGYEAQFNRLRANRENAPTGGAKDSADSSPMQKMAATFTLDGAEDGSNVCPEAEITSF